MSTINVLLGYGGNATVYWVGPTTIQTPNAGIVYLYFRSGGPLETQESSLSSRWFPAGFNHRSDDFEVYVEPFSGNTPSVLSNNPDIINNWALAPYDQYPGVSFILDLGDLQASATDDSVFRFKVRDPVTQQIFYDELITVEYQP